VPRIYSYTGAAHSVHVLHSGINKAVAEKSGTLISEALDKGKAQFMDRHHGEEPTYGDVLATDAYQLRAQGFQYGRGFDLYVAAVSHNIVLSVLHALGADCSSRDKRFPVKCFCKDMEDKVQKVWDKTSKGVIEKPATVGGNAHVLSTVFAAYFRVFARAHTIGAVELRHPITLCCIQLSCGVFGASQELCAGMFALALRAFAEVSGIPSFLVQ
jgi:hypothetical protein